MPFPVPSRDDLVAQILADQQVRIPGADTYARFNVLGIMAKVWAGGLALVWGFLGRYWVKQFFVDSAESPYLERRVAPYGIFPEGGTPAAGPLTVAGTNGIPIPAGTVFVTPPNVTPQYQYTSDATVTIEGYTASVSIVATGGGIDGFGNGASGNQNAGAILMFYTGIAGVAPAGAVGSGGLVGGSDPESDDSLRARGLARQRQSPQGGAWFDYVAWAKTVPGVTRVWVYPLNRGAGTVDVTFVMDGRSNNIPLSGDVANVQAAINNFRPVTADALVWAPSTVALPITVTGMVPGDSGTQGAVIAQLNALARSVAPGGAMYGDGVSTVNAGGFLYLSQIDAAIQAEGSVLHFDLTVPTADITFAFGTVPQAPTVTFA